MSFACPRQSALHAVNTIGSIDVDNLFNYPVAILEIFGQPE
jgi:hypothetical protein